jgi:hypothetical protein
MAFAFNTLILNRIPVTYSGGRLMLNGSGLAYASEAAASVTGLTVESGDARYVNITGDETVLGVKTFTGALMAQAGATSSGNILISKGNPRLQFRDTSAGGHSQGFDVHVSSDRFYIDDNTHNLIFLDYGVVNNLDTLSFKSNQFAVYSSASGVTPQLALLVDSGRNTRVSGNLYVSGVLIDNAGNPTIDPKNYYLQSNGLTSLDWTERSASSSSGLVSLSWEDRTLYDSSEATSLAWSDRQLSGNWSTNTVPNWSGSVVNKGYIDSITGSLGGGAIPSDVVRTTGNQYIIGNKTFEGEFLIIDDTFAQTCSLSYRVLNDQSESVSVDWASRILSGTWSTNTTPTSDYHLVNKLWVSQNPSSYSVATTGGVQYITGQKTFRTLEGGKSSISNSALLKAYEGDLSIYEPIGDNLIFSASECQLRDSSAVASLDFSSRHLKSGSSISLDWANKQLSGNWSTDTSPTQSGHIANKSYVDSNNAYCLGFGHAVISPVDGTSYYFGGCHGEAPNTLGSDASVVYAVNSGTLKSVVGNSFVAGTLGSSENVSLVVSLNGTDIATGTYRMTGRNNIIQSGLQSINRSVSKYDVIQMRFVSPSWVTNPINVRHNVNAYFTVG